MSASAGGRNDPCPCGSGRKFKKCCCGAAPASPQRKRYIGLFNHRVGHLALNTELYLCERDAGLHSLRDDRFFLITPFVCNEQLLRMWKRVLRFENPTGGSDVCRIYDLVDSNDPRRLLPQTLPHLCFTAKEEEAGRRQLEQWGIDGPFICLNVRDSAYLPATQGVPAEYWNYHNYRNADVATYVPAAEYLADEGFDVLRLGAVVNQAMLSRHPKVIDYATNGMRSDFMDIYLAAKCEWMFTTASGIDAVSSIFRRPCLWSNYIPASIVPLYHPGSMVLAKHLRDRDGRLLSPLEESQNTRGAYGEYEYEREGMEVIGNTSDELLLAAQAMVDKQNSLRNAPDRLGT